ncbi:CLUMA_CG002838, isoform A [Clunio marinus]|uniref:CLUMA_CG002838, isoform A n=1 Tax=Clunio marinus TaxID=568069 RepID=A0A1J1HL20_9DIPT|nr:CLUMA_CG002838, isoform A [Clunio marinus]
MTMRFTLREYHKNETHTSMVPSVASRQRHMLILHKNCKIISLQHSVLCLLSFSDSFILAEVTALLSDNVTYQDRIFCVYLSIIYLN